jgi:hypothetical protein
LSDEGTFRYPLASEHQSSRSAAVATNETDTNAHCLTNHLYLITHILPNSLRPLLQASLTSTKRTQRAIAAPVLLLCSPYLVKETGHSSIPEQSNPLCRRNAPRPILQPVSNCWSQLNHSAATSLSPSPSPSTYISISISVAPHPWIHSWRNCPARGRWVTLFEGGGNLNPTHRTTHTARHRPQETAPRQRRLRKAPPAPARSRRHGSRAPAASAWKPSIQHSTLRRRSSAASLAPAPVFHTTPREDV